MNFFQELKRRSVYKVAVAYAVVAWLLIQIATQTFPFFEIPNWAIRFVILLLIFGFPVALVIAWAFELTPEGIKRTDSDTHAPPERSRPRIWLLVVIGAGVLSVALFFLGRQTAAPRVARDATAAKSVAVLPFENRSEDQANAYFTEGIQDEILTRLAKIDDLKVISRTSTQRYKSSPDNLPEIAKQLGVAHVVEGSVQRSGDQVRVNVQLINAETDAHLWAEVYDRKIADLFAVQSEIAETIAKALQVKLSPREKQAVAARLTENPEAYDAYLRGLALWNGLSVSPETLRKAEEFFRRAVDLDPKFAQAWANLSIVQTFVYAEFDPMTQRLVDAKRALQTSMRLAPDLGDGFLALGLYRYRGLRDYDGALEAFQEALDRGVNRAMSLEFMGYVKRRQGRWKETLALHAESSALDPRNAIIFSERAVTLRALRRFAEAHAEVDHALEINPGSSVLLAQKARLYQAEGDLTAAAKLIERFPLDRQQPELTETHVAQMMLTRRFAEAVRVLEELLANPDPLTAQLTAVYRSRLGLAKHFAGDTEGARADLTRARDEFEALRLETEKGEGFLGWLISIAAFLGDTDAVDRHAARLDEQIAKDAFYGPALEQVIAEARAQLGQKDAALAIVRGLLQKPGDASLTTALLRADPVWDPLRSDPRFQTLANAKP